MDLVSVAVNDRQLPWAQAISQLAQRVMDAKSVAQGGGFGAGESDGHVAVQVAAAPAPLVGGVVEAAAEVAAPPSGQGLVSPQARPPRPQMKALGAFGRLWDYVVDEPTYLRNLDGECSSSTVEAIPARASPGNAGMPQPARQCSGGCSGGSEPSASARWAEQAAAPVWRDVFWTR